MSGSTSRSIAVLGESPPAGLTATSRALECGVLDRQMLRHRALRFNSCSCASACVLVCVCTCMRSQMGGPAASAVLLLAL